MEFLRRGGGPGCGSCRLYIRHRHGNGGQNAFGIYIRGRGMESRSTAASTRRHVPRPSISTDGAVSDARTVAAWRAPAGGGKARRARGLAPRSIVAAASDAAAPPAPHSPPHTPPPSAQLRHTRGPAGLRLSPHVPPAAVYGPPNARRPRAGLRRQVSRRPRRGRPPPSPLPRRSIYGTLCTVRAIGRHKSQTSPS